MQNLFKQRRHTHFMMLIKYYRLVFNDHFIIALLFFMGFLSFSYGNFLKSIGTQQWWGKIVVFMILLMSLQIGRMATLIEEADTVFLLPRERDLHQYFVASHRYSLVLGELIQIAIFGATIPMMIVIAGMSFVQIGIMGISLFVLKWSWMLWKLIGCYQAPVWSKQNDGLMKWLIPGLIFAAGLWISPIITLVLAIIELIVLDRYHARHWQQFRIAWQADVDNETNRMLGLLRFFNLFTDVPQLSGQVRRRRWLDWVLPRLNYAPTQTYRFLYTRGMLRGTEFSGLYLRLTVIGAILLYFVKIQWLNLSLFALFIYLIAVQLLPFYKQYDNIVFTHIYPVEDTIQLISFKHLLATLLLFASGVFIVATLIAGVSLQLFGSQLILALIEVWLIGWLYAPYRLTTKK